MLTAYGPYLWIIFILYLVVGWYLVRNFPVKTHVGSALETIFLWPSVYGKHLKVIWKFHGTINEPIVKYYLMEEWDKLILRVPVWKKISSGEEVVLYRVIEAKVYAKSIDFPPFIGFSTDMKIGRKAVSLLSSRLSYSKDDFGNACWDTNSGKTAYTGDIIVMNGNKDKFAVIGVNDLKNYVPW